MTEHVIYGLYHQDVPDEILYVGSWKLAGWQERIEQHRQGKSTMVRRGANADGLPLDEIDGRVLCRWETGNSPEYQIIRRYKKVGWARWNSRAFAMSSEDNRRGGRRGGRRNVESGHLASICCTGGVAKAAKWDKANPELAAESRRRGARKSVEWAVANPEAAFERNSRAGRIGGRVAVESGQIYKIATPESRAKGGRVAAESGQIADLGRTQGRKNAGILGLMVTLGRSGNHNRWHVNRGIVKPGCELCDELAGNETAPEGAVSPAMPRRALPWLAKPRLALPYRALLFNGVIIP